MNALVAVATDCVAILEARGVSVDDAKREEITWRVLTIASRGIADPAEIRELVVAHFAS
jgi:hypothetical protein